MMVLMFPRKLYLWPNSIKAEGKINDVVIENMMNWRHSGFKSQLVLSAIYPYCKHSPKN
jgi:hypothetical protein